MRNPCQRINFSLLIFLLTGLLLSIALRGYGQEKEKASGDKKIIYVFELKGEISPVTRRIAEVSLREAQKKKADIVILDLDTFGGLLSDADEIRKLLLNFERPVWAFVNKNAASAGALIAIACDSIYMAGGASIGAATVVTPDGAPAMDKYQSYMRSMMRATASENGRDPRIAEAMVDESIDLDSLKPIGKILTLTTDEAIALRYCEGERNSVEEILKANAIKDYQLERYQSSWVDAVIAVFLNPAVSGILILVIIGGIYFELQTPGVGFPLIAAITALILYFIPYYLTGLAENWELLLFVVGLALLGLEIFVIPGFGIAGVSGLIAVFASLVLMMIGNDGLSFELVAKKEIYNSLLVAALGIFGGLGLIVAFAPRLLNSKSFQKITLSQTLGQKEGYVSSLLTEELIGKQGLSHTVLRPGGKVMIEGQLYDAVSQAGGFIAAQKQIEVVSREGAMLRVREVLQPATAVS